MTTHLEAGAPAEPCAPAPSSWRSASGPLLLDLGLPFAAYLLARHAVGTSMVTALVASSVASLAGLVVTAVRDRRIATMSALVLVVTLLGVVLGFASGSARFVSGKDAVLSIAIGVGVLVSVGRGSPALAGGLRPFVTRGRADREAAWARLVGASPRADRLVARHSVVFGVAFVVDSLVRLGCAVLAPVSVLGWIGTAATVAALVVASVVSGVVAADPLERLLDGAPAAEAVLRREGCRVPHVDVGGSGEEGGGS